MFTGVCQFRRGRAKCYPDHSADKHISPKLRYGDQVISGSCPAGGVGARLAGVKAVSISHLETRCVVSRRRRWGAEKGFMRTTHNLVEGAGAAPFAAIGKMRKELEGKKVVGIMTGGNVDGATLKRVLAG